MAYNIIQFIENEFNNQDEIQKGHLECYIQKIMHVHFKYLKNIHNILIRSSTFTIDFNNKRSQLY